MERVAPEADNAFWWPSYNRIKSEMAKTGQPERTADNIANNSPFQTAIGKSGRN